MTDAERFVPGVRIERVDVGEVSLEVARVGAGAPTLFLHGFPEAWLSWRHQMRAFAAAGREAIAPNLRGYGGSDKPAGVASYRMERLVGDVVGLVRALGHEKVDLVGHDWGGAIAFEVAARHPEIVRRLAVLNAPHPRAFRRALLVDGAQRRRSWYMFFFQLPLAPERVVMRPDFLRRAMKGTAAHPERFDDDALDAIQRVVQSPGSPRAALAYYRAAFRWPRVADGIVRGPTLVVWGEKDHALGTSLLDDLERYVQHVLVHPIPDASHWVQQDAPEEVSDTLLTFLG